ncbi:MAG TPA: response regulator transcription factor [Gemmatimonadaceae bacterium]
MASGKMLVVDDEPQIRRVVRNSLASEADGVLEAATGSEAIALAAAEKPTLIVLDLGLPDMAGVDVCREIRSWSTAPIIVLSARHSESEKVALLDAGADDYITKPFHAPELQARVRAQLRRRRLSEIVGPSEKIEVPGVSIDLAKPSLKKDGVAVHLTKTEWAVLRTLVRHAGRTLTHRQIFHEVWGNSYGDMQQHLRVHIRSLRRKIEKDSVRPQLIVTEPGVGYRFENEP